MGQILQNMGRFLWNWLVRAPYNVVAGSAGTAYQRWANISVAMIPLFFVMLWCHVHFESGWPIGIYGALAMITALCAFAEMANFVAMIDASFAWMRLPQQGVRAAMGGLDDLQKCVDDQRAMGQKYVSDLATKFGKVLAGLEFCLGLASFFFVVFPFYRIPWAGSLILAGISGLLLAWPIKKTVTPNKLCWWLVAAAIGVLAFTLILSPHSVYSVTGARATLVSGLFLFAVAGLRLIGFPGIIPATILAIGILAQAFPAEANRMLGEYRTTSHISGQKWRVTWTGGCSKLYPGQFVQGASLSSVTTRGNLRNGKYYFEPMPNPVNPAAERLQPGDIVCQLENDPTVGFDGELYLWVVLVRENGRPEIDVQRKSFYLPLIYITKMRPEDFSVAYVSTEPLSRIDPREGYPGSDRLSKRFATLSPFNSPFVDAPAGMFASPLEDGSARILNVFKAPRGQFGEHLAVDLLPSGGKRSYLVLASADGEVVDLTLKDPYLSVTLRHAPIDGDTTWTHYGHLFKVVDSVRAGRLKVGAQVKQGETIGEISASGQKWYPEGPHLHFVVLGRSADESYTRPRDPLRYLGRLAEPVDVNGIELQPLRLQASGPDSDIFWVPPNFTVGQVPLFVWEGDDVELEVISGSYYPNQTKGEPDYRLVDATGLSGVPKYGFQFARAVPDGAYAALAYGLDGLQATFVTPQFATFTADRQGWLCLGLNEFVMHHRTGVRHDGAADNMGAGFLVRVKVTRNHVEADTMANM